MKKSVKITLCAVAAALSSTFMLTSYFPYLTYAIPGIAGLFMLLPLVEISAGYAFLSFGVSAAIVFISAEPQAAAVYVFLLGYYPVLKALIEKLKNRVLEWIIKIVVLNIAVFTIYYITTFIFKINIEDMGDFGKYSAYILLIACNIVFIIYDFAVTKMGELYMIRIHPLVKKIGKY